MPITGIKPDARFSSISTASGLYNHRSTVCTQWRGNYFWTGEGGKIGNAKLMGPLSNLDRVFVPEISVLKKKVFAGFGPRFCPRNKRSLKTKKRGLRRLPIAFVWLRIQF